MRHRRFLAAAAAGLAALAPAACAPARNQFAPACPVPGLVKPLSELTRYRPGSQDVRDLVVRARVTDIRGTCRPGTNGTVLATVQVVADVTRGPAMEGREYVLPMFAAVTEGETIRDKDLFSVPVEFARGQDVARVTSAEIEMELPVSLTKTAAAFGVIGGFQLTSEDVAAYRRNRR